MYAYIPEIGGEFFEGVCAADSSSHSRGTQSRKVYLAGSTRSGLISTRVSALPAYWVHPRRKCDYLRAALCGA